MPASFAVSLTPLMMATRLRAHRWCALFTGHTTPYAGIIALTRYAASGRFSFLHPPTVRFVVVHSVQIRTLCMQ
jgi:hypothetical protein